MGKYFDSGYKFFMQREGSDAAVDIEEAFRGLVYKSMSGLEDEGSPKVYEETYAERDKALVYVAESGVKSQTSLTLTLYFFDAEKNEEDAVAVENASKCYHDFLDFVSGAKVLYWDDVRKRKVVMYLSESTSPKTDRLYGKVYKEVEFKFKNVYGRSFDASEKIEF